jgi:hypothetical protein
LVITCTVVPMSGTSAHGKPRNTLTKTPGYWSSHRRARAMMSITGDAPVHCSTVAVTTGTAFVTRTGVYSPRMMRRR